VRPFLKWAGGKRQLLPALRPYYPATAFNRYIEPFLGSAAVFFDLAGSGRLDGRRAVLADLNADLISCYHALRDDTDAVIYLLTALQRKHQARGAECYYEIRERFNARKAGRAGAAGGAGGASMAAMFIYLNRTGFNGLFRLNSAGAFNVPAGRYANPTICDAEQLRACAHALRQPGVTLTRRPFDETLAEAGRGDFVYCDPPYAPLSATSLFAHYTAGGFTLEDHERLQAAIIGAAGRGAVVVVSNSSAPAIESAYGSRAAKQAGLRVRRVPARRAINSRASARGPVDELIITNAPPAAPRPGSGQALDVPLRMARAAAPITAHRRTAQR
jgi:DNA adenine methylase